MGRAGPGAGVLRPARLGRHGRCFFAERRCAAPVGRRRREISSSPGSRSAPDGRSLASGSDDSTVRLWSVTGPSDAGPAKGINGVAFSRTGSRCSVRRVCAVSPSLGSPDGEHCFPGVEYRPPSGPNLPRDWFGAQASTTAAVNAVSNAQAGSDHRPPRTAAVGRRAIVRWACAGRSGYRPKSASARATGRSPDVDTGPSHQGLGHGRPGKRRRLRRDTARLPQLRHSFPEPARCLPRRGRRTPGSRRTTRRRQRAHHDAPPRSR
ncbi:hypothetical protein A4R44_04469 [Amycolatopsis sp. M39]|nr:hypothetical protein A4R44_04469 [Amycolatopsis sp. M39]